MPHFYATAEDLLPIFESVESRRCLRYTLSGDVIETSVQSFQSGAQLPTLHSPMTHPNAVACPAYLVSDENTEIILRNIGERKWAIDQLSNPDTTIVWHGGMYGESTLLYGRIATASNSKVAASLQRAFDAAIKKHFVLIKAFYVGSHAETLLDSGFRLTIGADSPEDYDLKR